jgi:hypothetical protein
MPGGASKSFKNDTACRSSLCMNANNHHNIITTYSTVFPGELPAHLKAKLAARGIPKNVCSLQSRSPDV